MNRPRGRSGSEGAWVAAVIVIAICLVSSFTLTKGSDASNAAAGRGGGRSASGASGAGDTLAVDDGGAGGSSSVSGGDSTGSGGADAAGGVGGAAAAKGGAAKGAAPGPAGGKGATPATKVGAGSLGSANCSGNKNNGATDVGITGNSINLAATVVRTGIAKDFLFDAQYGMAAVQKLANQKGGICGRLVNIHEDDDGWDPSTGAQLIQKYIACKCYFALAVNPSSEGLRNVLDSGTIDQAQFPVVGSDGMLIDQYQHPWIWPVATSTHSAMHVILDEAYARGARHVAIVWESSYRFGVEGDKAFEGEARRKGVEIVVSQKEQGGQPSYKNDASTFVGKCSNSPGDLGKCDFIALLLEPGTADQWVRDGGLGDGDHHPQFGIGSPQPLFLNAFANDCGAPCNGLQVWTGFKPPISPFDSDPAVSSYKSAVQAVTSSADTNNPEVEGAFQGMLLLVQALNQLGPAPTRAELKDVLDSTTLDSGLGPPAQFRSGNHFAATSVQPFQAVYNGPQFVGWRFPAGGGFIADGNVNDDL